VLVLIGMTSGGACAPRNDINVLCGFNLAGEQGFEP